MRSPCTAMKSSPHLPQLEKARTQQQRPNTANKKIKNFFKMPWNEFYFCSPTIYDLCNLKKIANLSHSVFLYIYYNLKYVSIVDSIVFPKNICLCLNLQNLWMLPYLEKWVFADVNKLKILRWAHSRLFGWVLNLMTSFLVRDTERRQMERIKQYDRGGRDWSYVTTTSKKLATTKRWKKIGTKFPLHL